MRVVLPYSGSPAASAAVRQLVEQGLEVVTLTLDVGQSEPLDGIRARALACGATRAHVVDARETFARTCVIPAMQQPGADLETLAAPLISRTLAEVAAIEGADPVTDEAVDAVATGTGPREHHLLLRGAVHPSRALETDARLDVTLENGIPTALNGVPMALTELIESVSVIAGRHAIGHDAPVQAPAAVVLRAAYEHAASPTTTVRLTLHKGTLVVQPPVEQHAALVSHS